MLFECKVYDAEGNLKKIHTRKQLEKRSREKCLEFLPDAERKIIEGYGNYKRGEDDSEVTIYTLLF